MLWVRAFERSAFQRVNKGPISTAQVARGEVVNIFGGGEKCLPVGGIVAEGGGGSASPALRRFEKIAPSVHSFVLFGCEILYFRAMRSPRGLTGTRFFGYLPVG